MNTRRRIRLFTPQYIARPLRAWIVFALFSIAAFIVLCLSTWMLSSEQSLIQGLGLYAVISPLIILGLFFDTKVLFKFPYPIQKHVIDPKLKSDLQHMALRSSTGKILNYRMLKNHFWQAKRPQLLLDLNDHADPIWFNIDLSHVFSTQYFRQIEVEANPKIIGQKVHVYYLAASKQVIQMYGQSDDDDFEILKRYLAQPYSHQVVVEHIPSRLIQDLPNIIKIEAIREHAKYYVLKLETSYGQAYKINSNAKAFDQLELALASMIDFLSYRRFKHDASIEKMTISKAHPYRFRNLILYSLMLILPILSFVSQNWIFALIGVFIAWFYIKSNLQQKIPPFISEEHY